jgi:hypothetical protein
MGHRPPLGLAELAALYDHEPTPVVRELLWEIHRLQSTIRRAQQVREMTRHAPAGVPEVIWLAFEHELDSEPCLRDPLTPRQQARSDKWVSRRAAERQAEDADSTGRCR